MHALLGFHDLQVVLVEPSRAQSSLIRRMLEQQGLSILGVVESGGEALSAMEALEPNLVISSLYLPDMAGTELVKQMRARPALEDVPFILISSETRPQMLDPVRQAGACSILPKPFGQHQLQRALIGAVDYLTPEVSFDGLEPESLRVLLVDDSRTSLRHYRRMLVELGVRQIWEAGNGVEAVALLAETMVDLVITDYNMPEMDGHHLVEYIRRQSWQSSVPVLMVTSEHDQQRLAAVERAGVSAICDKPFEQASIRRLVAEALAD
ncbi:MAG: response regulator [Rhodocyclaceae bacterium]|nr:response regulator [Rhodocyclaceae bacterium]